MPIPWSMASAGVENWTGRPLTLIVPVIRLLHAVHDLPQGGLAGAVLPDQSVDRPAVDRDVDVVVGDDTGEPLPDALELDRLSRRVRLCWPPMSLPTQCVTTDRCPSDNLACRPGTWLTPCGWVRP